MGPGVQTREREREREREEMGPQAKAGPDGAWPRESGQELQSYSKSNRIAQLRGSRQEKGWGEMCFCDRSDCCMEDRGQV